MPHSCLPTVGTSAVAAFIRFVKWDVRTCERLAFLHELAQTGKSKNCCWWMLRAARGSLSARIPPRRGVVALFAGPVLRMD